MELLPNKFSHIRIVGPGDKVHKDECVCSFDTAESEDGLYICMKTHEAVGSEFLDYYYNRYGYSVYLHHKRLKYKINKPESSDTKPKRLAIGLEGGFDPDAANKDYRIENTYSIVILPERQHIQFPNPELPEIVIQSANSIIEAESFELKDNATNVWDGEQREVSKYAVELQQLNPAPKIPPSGWKCEKCDLRENIWLNLTDGSILCGRRFFDGSGGNNHAAEHYEDKKYPLAVKLGTITATGADVYSYPEGEMVIDPLLDKHLAHFGINIQDMRKTEKSMLELEIDMNEKLGEWSLIQEEGKNLEQVAGPGFTGLINLGNSCYMNSVLQVLFSIQEFQNRFYPPTSIYNYCDGIRDFNFQMAKLAYGLLSGRYSAIDPVSHTQKGIQPKSFKHYVCGQDRNFASKRQQDAHEFFLYLLDQIERNDKDGRFTESDDSGKWSNGGDPSKCLEFVIEDRIQCTQSKRVKYKHRVESCLSLHVDPDLAINKNEVEEYKQKNPNDADIVRPLIPMQACLELFAKTETLTDFYSSAIGSHTTAEKTSKISRFPSLLVLQMKKFQCGADWIPKKMDVAFDVPDILNLEHLEGKGLQSDEVELEETPEGGPENVIGSGETGSGSESAGVPALEADSEAVATMLSMGIDLTQAITALKMCNNDTQRAIEYIFDPDSFQPANQSSSAQQQPGCSSSSQSQHQQQSRLTVATRTDPLKMKLFTPDNKPKLYQLKAFISHMGSSTLCGHYVCHIKRDERWYIYNDNKVALSKNPPKEFGYLYFYERLTL